MAGALVVTLPWPPSVNRLWRHVVAGGRVRVLMSRAGREWKGLAVGAVRRDAAFAGDLPIVCGVLVDIRAHPPDRRKRDLDNLLKPVLDALTAGGAWLDDSQVDGLSIVRCPPVPGGKLEISIRRME